MSRTGGEETKKRILQVAEKLFADNGFNGTSVSMIAKAAGVNKALIYYHFKDKNDIIACLFKNVVEELNMSINVSLDTYDHHCEDIEVQKKKIKEEIKYAASKKKIITVMLMETLKGHNRENPFFQCAEAIINHELSLDMKHSKHLKKHFTNKEQHFIHEFFTGFLPIIFFVVFQDKWCEYFECDPDEFKEFFLESFVRSHMSSHLDIPIEEQKLKNKKKDNT